MERASSAVRIACPWDGRRVRPARRSLCLRGLVALVAVAGLWSCETPQAPPRAVEAPEPLETAPEWVRQPLSWSKLDAIEAWLVSAQGRHDGGLVNEARLQLHEGRLEFARRDIERGTTPAGSMKLRVEAARAGFQEVLDAPAASPGQRARAKVGLQGSAALLVAPVAAPGLPMVQRERWGALPAKPANMTELRGTWARITIHHSAESSSNPKGGSFEDSASTVQGIQRYHLEDPGHRWGDLGYHFLIDAAGRIFEGRDLRYQGAHVRGDNGVNNYQNLGVCMLGDFSRGAPTPAALQSLKLLLDHLRAQYRIPARAVHSHADFVTTECPGQALTSWIKRYGR